MNVTGFTQSVLARIGRKRKLESDLKPRGAFFIEHFRNGKKIAEYTLPNGVTNVGKNHALDTIFTGSTQVSPWYLGLIDASGYTGVAAGDTMSSHAGWAEATSYDQTNRVEWTEGAAASQSITNATPVQFDINATKTLKGVFLTSNNTKGGTTGTLWATALFSADISVNNGDDLKITYTVNAT